MRTLALFIALFFIFTAPARAESILNIQPVQSPGGIKAWLVEDKTIPVITIAFAFRGGITQDPADQTGRAYMTSILLDEGAGNYDSHAFQQALQKNAIELSFTAGRDAFFGNLRTLTKNKAKAFELLTLALTSPRFDPDAIERMRAAHLAKIRRDMGNPNWQAARSFNGMAFEGHPYARPGHGTLRTIQSLQREDLKAFTDQNFARDNLLIAVAGDITSAELTAVLDHVFGPLPARAQLQDVPAANGLKYGGQILRLNEDIPQTIISIGQPALPRNHPDWYALRLVNFILGESGFGSRLMEELREKRGLTYGIYTSVVNQDHADLIQISTSTVNSKAMETLMLIQSEWQRMTKTGPTEKELANAKAYLIGALPLQLTSTSGIASVLLGLQLDKLPPDHLDQRQKILQSVSLEDTRRVARDILDIAKLTTVLVGQPENIEADITLNTPPGME